MKIKFLVEIDPKHRTGLFNSVKDRVDYWDGECEVYNLSYYDSLLCKIIKKIFGKKSKKKKDDFKLGSVTVKNIYLKRGMLDILAKVFPNFKCIIFRRDREKVKKIFDLKEGISLVNAHWAVSAGIIAYQVTRNTDNKCIITCHGSDIHTYPVRDRALRRYVRESLENVDGCIFVSNKLMEQAKKLGYSANNGVVVYNGIDVQKFKYTPKTRL